MILVMLIIMKIMCNSPNHITLAWIPNHHRSKDPLSLGRPSKRDQMMIRCVLASVGAYFPATCLWLERNMKLRDWEHEDCSKSCGNYRFWDGFMFHYGSVFFLAGTFFFGGGECPRSFWSCQAFFRSCYLRYQCQSSDYCKSRLNPGVCSYQGCFSRTTGLRDGIFAGKILCCVWGTLVTICNNSRIVHIEPHLVLEMFHDSRQTSGPTSFATVCKLALSKTIWCDLSHIGKQPVLSGCV